MVHKDKAAEAPGHPHQPDMLGLFRLAQVLQPLPALQLLGAGNPALEVAPLQFAQAILVLC